MSEENKQTIVVHNGSQRVIRTSKGILGIGESLELDAEEAKSILGYSGIRDTSKMVPQQANTIEALRKRVNELEETNKNLEAQIKQLTPERKIEEPPEEEPEEKNVREPAGKKGRR